MPRARKRRVHFLLGAIAALAVAGWGWWAAWGAGRAGAGEESSTTATPTAAGEAEAGPVYELHADRWWLLNLPGGRRFDASGLARTADGGLWTVNDQTPGVWRILLPLEGRDATLEPVPGILTTEQRAGFAREKITRWDCEGIALDDRGRVYVSEEANRWILRWDPATAALERLAIDWAPVRRFFHPTELNASLEGVAVHGDRLYVANERQTGRIIEVDLGSMKVVGDFSVAPPGGDPADTHYSDLCWADGALWALLRDVRKVVKVDAPARRVLATFDYAAMETAREVAYGAFYAPGFMEGLAVDDEHLWLLSDNNGFGRRAASNDTRPTLFRCRRPDRDSGASR